MPLVICKPAKSEDRPSHVLPIFTNELVSTGDSATFTLQTQSNEQEWLRNYEHCHMSDYSRLHNGQKVTFN